MRAVILFLFALVGASSAFVSPLQRAQVVKAASPPSAFILKMSEEPEAEGEPKAVQPNTDGALYDDDVPENKPLLSDNMRARLLAEASSGLDSEKKQTNVILYIIVAVAALVVAGGQGIFF